MANLAKLKKNGFEFICGVDEAGRGPLAGPMSLGFFCVSIDKYKEILKPLLKIGLNDSKKLIEGKREELFKEMKYLRHSLEEGNRSFQKSNKHGSRIKSGMTGAPINYLNAMISAREIDEKGISKCMQILIKKLLSKTQVEKTYYLLDGAIKFPKNISHEVIIKGDSKEPVIMAASIVAKVSRDKIMKKLAKKYTNYNLEIHKGYGTLLHRNAIRKYGFSEIHRKSFCKNIKIKNR